MYRIILVFIILPLICGCGQSGDQTTYEEMDELIVADMEASSEVRLSANVSTSPAPPPESAVFEKKIIKNGNLTIESKNLAASKQVLDSLVNKYTGYASSENFSDQGNQISFSLTYRIPAEKFDNFLAAVEDGPDKILNKSINANDVSEQYYDIKTRLKNEKQVEKRYLELLDKARTVKDILGIEEKLGKVRQEIESKEGRLRYLDDRVNYSTLNIWIYQKKEIKYEPADRDRFSKRLVRSLHKGWQGFIDVFLFILRLWPLWLTGLLIWRLIVWLRRRSKRKNPSGQKLN